MIEKPKRDQAKEYLELGNSYEMVGVPSMVSAYGWGSVVSHMAWSRPISEIRIFLRNNKYGFILGDKPEQQEEVGDNDQ